MSTMEKYVKSFNKLLRKSVNFENLGFNEQERDTFFFSWILQKESKNKIDVIRYSFLKDKWGDDCKLNSITSYIVFPKVNAILFSLIKEERYLFDCNEDTIIRIPHFNLRVDDYVQKQKDLLFVKNRVMNEQVFEEALAVFQEQLETSVLPFFDKIQTLQQVNDEILEKIDWKEWHKYISGFHGVHYLKSIIIMKLCNNEKGYKEFTEMYKQLVLDALNNGRTEVQELYDNLINLLEYLDSGKYLEII